MRVSHNQIPPSASFIHVNRLQTDSEASAANLVDSRDEATCEGISKDALSTFYNMPQDFDGVVSFAAIMPGR